MLFNSYEFIFGFLPIALATLFIVGRFAPQLAPAWLTLLSLFFYGWWKAKYLWLLVASVTVNFLIGRALARASAAGKPNKPLLVVGIAANLGLLGYFKYAGFFVHTIETVTGHPLGLAAIGLPIGISFFTFTQIAYLVDAHRGLAREYDFFRYSLFVTYFPHLIAGPILHHREMMPQFRRGAFRFTGLDLSVGGALFIIGLAKKVLFADSIAPVADGIFSHAGDMHLTIAEAWTGALAYTLQIYFDFSGYSDMALGLSRMIGVRMPLNFNSPYKAANIIEFWRRWHMTLSRFLRDYLYFPLGGNRRGRPRRYANLMITMALGGLWHGAAWTFVLWGALHGAYLCINHAWRALRSGKVVGRAERAAGWAVTFLAVTAAWVFFRAESFGGALSILHAMGGGNGIALPAKLVPLLPRFAFLDAGGMFQHGLIDPVWALPLTAALLAIAFGLPNSQEIMARYRPAFQNVAAAAAAWRWRPTPAWGVALGILLAACLTLVGGPSPFLYFRF